MAILETVYEKNENKTFIKNKEMYNGVYFLIAFIFLLSCKNNHEQIPSKNNRFETIKIDIDNISQVQLSTFVEEIKYVPLETNGIPLGRSSFYGLFGNKFYILENLQSSEKLSVFDLSGKLKLVLDKMGRGPGEFISADDFFVNKETGIIEILDNQKKAILYYDSLGQFITKKSNPKISLDFIKHNKKYYQWAGNLGYKNKIGYSLHISDLDLNELNVKFPIADEMNNVVIRDRWNFHNYNGKLFLSHALNDTIYKVNADAVTPEYVIDFGDNKLSKEIFQRKDLYTLDLVKEIQNKSLTMGIQTALQNDKLLYFHSSSGRKKNYYAFYYKQNQKVYYSDKIENDIDQGIFGTPFHLTNEYLYVMIQPYDLLKKIKSEKPVVKNTSNLVKLLREIDYNSNPIVMVCKLKK